VVNFGPLAVEICWRVSRLGSVTARHSGIGRQPNFAALNRGRHLYSAGQPSCWALAHILAETCIDWMPAQRVHHPPHTMLAFRRPEECQRSSRDAAYLKFNLFVIQHITISCFPNYPFLGKWYNFDQLKEVCILQGSAVTFFSFCGQIHNRVFQISSGFCLSKIIIIGSHLTQLFKT